MKYKALNKALTTKKILPPLCGIKKNYITKGKCLKTIIQFLIKKIEVVKSSLKDESEEKNTLNLITKDLLVLSRYEKDITYSFYFNFQSIINNY